MTIINKNLKLEEEILIEILFKNKQSFDLNKYKICEEKLIKLASSHLMLPSLYTNIIKKKYKSVFSNEFLNYLKEIYEINRNRNKILLEEVAEISRIFKVNKINHIFLKGSSIILNKIHNDLGERMIGDIDFLFDKNQTSKMINSMLSMGYEYKSNYPFFEHRHLERMIHKEKMFAVEPHTYLIKKNKHILNSRKFLDEKKNHNSIITPTFKNMILNNIYNYQINDYGKLKMTYSYRNIYDTIALINKSRITFDNIPKNNFVSNYFWILKTLKIIKTNEIFRINKVSLIRFWLSYNNRFLRNLNIILIRNFLNLRRTPKIIYELLRNKNYRIYIIKKFKGLK